MAKAKDTYFVDAINFLKRKKQTASLCILQNFYERSKIERYLNEIGKQILASDGEPLTVAQIIQPYANELKN